MIIDILTLFPEMFDGVINSSIIKRAIEKGIVEIRVHDYRDFSTKQNKRVDDYSYGGGAGMVIEALPVVNCLKTIEGYERAKKLITAPIGYKYDQKKAEELSKEDHVIIICGHYEGIDHRIMNYVDESISIGDYNGNLTGATRYYYSETVPTTSGNYWHYGDDGVPTPW